MDSLDIPIAETPDAARDTAHEFSPAPGTKKVFIKTYGCQMNVYDSERMSEALRSDGYSETSTIESADLVVLNTCHIREKAVEKVYSDLGRIRDIKIARARAGNDTLIAVAGCVAQAEGGEIVRRARSVDIVIGPQSYHRLPELAGRARATGQAIVETEFPEESKFARLPEERRNSAPSAFLTVQEGCDKFCTFCVVPYTRGSEFSRSVAEITKEAERLVDRGVRELTLLGQNVNAYHGEGPDGRAWTLAALIRHLGKIDGLLRLRYMTSHPRDMGDDLIAAHGDQEKLMPFLHLPFQSGSDRILATMNRKHTAKDYLALVAKIRAARPEIALSTDIIVGFPGESERDFEATLGLVREVGFAQAYSFKYSARPGTPASAMEDEIGEAEKSERLRRLQACLDEQQAGFNTACVGRTLPVLFEKRGREPGQLVGRSPYLQLVHARADETCIGKVIGVEIASAGQNSLSGVIPASKNAC